MARGLTSWSPTVQAQKSDSVRCEDEISIATLSFPHERARPSRRPRAMYLHVEGGAT